jgi:glyoxylate/hydroxypyruvate reductase A
MMRILYYGRNMDADPWVRALSEALPGAEVAAWAPGSPPADYAVVWLPPQQLFDEQPALKAIFNAGAGVDALLTLRLPAAVPIVRITDAGMAVQMAEFVAQAVIRHYRELDEYARGIASGAWRTRPPRPRAAFPVGIMGLGVLGRRAAEAVAHFDFPVLGWTRTAREVPGVRCFSGSAGLHEFLAATRILVCLLPLTPDTENILNRDTLSRLMPGGYVINVARGAHLVDDDLVALLEGGHLAGATLDVFRTEPLPADHPFWHVPFITITPHLSARTLHAESVAQIAGRIRAFDRGEPVEGLVDRTRGY